MQLITKENDKDSYNSKVSAINGWQSAVINELKYIIDTISSSNNVIDEAFTALKKSADLLRTKCYLNQCLVDNLHNESFMPADIGPFKD